MSTKALAQAVLQRNRQGNNKETMGFPIAKTGKHQISVRKLKTEQEEPGHTGSLPEWQVVVTPALRECHPEAKEPVRCGDCLHFERDTVNPQQGRGNCDAGRTPAYLYPMAPKLCSSFKKLASANDQGQKPLSGNDLMPVNQWQVDFCNACGDLNNWRGCCPKSLDECLISRVLDAENNPERIKGISIGRGIDTDDVFRRWTESGEAIEVLFKQPLWLIAVAELLRKEMRDEY